MTETGGGETVTERLLRMLLDDQKQRDEENARREREHVLRVQQMEQQMTAMTSWLEKTSDRAESDGSTLSGERRRRIEGSDQLRLTRLTETEDVEAYLTTFQRMMSAYEIEKERWAYKLEPLSPRNGKHTARWQ